MKAKLLKIIGLSIVTAGLAASNLEAQISLNASDAGRVSDAGTGSTLNTSYLAGYNTAGGGVTFRDWFAFDLSGISGGVANASITIFEPANGFVSNVTPLNFALYDVTSSTATVLGGGTGLTSVYNDLGSGNSYGSVNVTSANNGTNITINLSGTFIADFIAHEGTTLLIGGAVTTSLPHNSFEEIFNGSGSETSGLTAGSVVLHFTPVPEPSTYALVGVGALAGLVAWKRRKNLIKTAA
jgi:PEP-CTERM motif